VQEAQGLYEQALFGVEAIFGRLSDKYQDLVSALEELRSNSEHSEHDTNCQV
jgi:hypothetical protein